MITTKVLKKATRNGFTVLPNKIIDDLLATAEKHTADSLALLIYCVRHIPAQKGTLTLQGAFAQNRVCKDLGWGPTNKQRLKRALQDLEITGVITTEVRDNNALLLHIEANLETQLAVDSEPKGGGEENETPPNKNSYPQGGKNSPTVYIKNKSQNNSQKNHLESVGESSATKPACSPSQNKDDDEIIKLCSLYTTRTRKTISTSQRVLFSRTYRENGSPLSVVEKAIEAIASHPKLLKDTVSINAVWQLDYMKKAARVFEFNTRDLIASLQEQCATNPEDEVLKAASESGVDIEVFKKYFADDLEKLRNASQKTDQKVQDSDYPEENLQDLIEDQSRSTLACPALNRKPEVCDEYREQSPPVSRHSNNLLPKEFGEYASESREGKAIKAYHFLSPPLKEGPIGCVTIQKNIFPDPSPKEKKFGEFLNSLVSVSSKNEIISILSLQNPEIFSATQRSKFDLIKEYAFSRDASFHVLKVLIASHLTQKRFASSSKPVGDLRFG